MKTITVIILTLSISQFVFSQEAQWRGPDRNGRFPEEGLLESWPEGGPEMILKVEELGMGFSTPVLHNEIIYITGRKYADDYLTAIDLKGNIKYQVKYGSSWNQSYPDTRSTPTIDSDRIYLISGLGEVVCLNIDDGSIIWSVDANKQYDGELHRWGVAESPLIVDDKVIYTSGGDLASLLAFNKFSGELEWQSKSIGGARTYVSPVLYENENFRLIVAATENYIFAVHPESGEIAWSVEFLSPVESGGRVVTININSPVYRDDEIFISKGYNMFGVMLKVGPNANQVQEKWRTEVLDTHHGHYILEGEYLYGSNWLSNSQGNWVCLAWKSGEVMYEEKWNTKGSVAYADGLLYCYEERGGNVALVKPTPKKFDIVSSFKIEYGSGPHWAHPYIAEKKLLIRHGEVLMVFDIGDKQG
jgi:outer membrane protein assembly factor BamB